MDRQVSEFEVRREEALKLLARTGIRKSNYLPPALRLLWALGVKVPPPHFAAFIPTFLVTGAFFGLSWGALMRLFVLGLMPGLSVLYVSISAGVLFGLSMAAYYAYGRSKHRLPPWSSLGRLAAGT